MRYRLIGLDFDGTLLGPDGHVSPANRAAMAAARQAGAMVVPCTGRCWQESRRHLSDLVDVVDIGVFVTGAAVCDIHTGHAQHTVELDPALALEIVQELAEASDAVLVFCDREKTGHDYLVTGQGELTANTRWWFEVNGLATTFKPHVTAADLAHALRVGMVTPARFARPKTAHLVQRFGPRITAHSFSALHMPGQVEPLDVLEVFAGHVDKWAGLAWVARREGIAREQIAVIGDEINDLAMLRQAGCGIAMGNACAALKAHARHVTRPNDQDGVAHAIENLLTGTW